MSGGSILAPGRSGHLRGEAIPSFSAQSGTIKHTRDWAPVSSSIQHKWEDFRPPKFEIIEQSGRLSNNYINDEEGNK